MKKRESKPSTHPNRETLLPEGSISPEGPKKEFDQVLSSLGFGFWQWLLIIICGVGSMVEAMESNLLSYTAPCAEEEWDLDDSQTSMVVSAAFIGELLGASVFGIASDLTGRRFCFAIAMTMMLIGTVATFYTQSYWELLFYTGVVGVGVSGASFVAFDYLSENLPAKNRGKFMQLLGVGRGIGSLLVAGDSSLFMSAYGWRFVALVCAVPVAVNLLMLFSISESPRWLLSQGRTEEAVEGLKYGAKLNCKEVDEFTLAPFETSSHKADIRELFRRPLLRSTLHLCVNWICFGFSYHAILVLISKLLKTSDSSTSSSDTCSFDYGYVAISASAEIVAPLISLLFIDKSRRYAQLACYFGAGFFTLGFGITSSDSFLAVVAFIARGMINIGSSVTRIITPELYPTEIRTTAHSFLYLVGHAGSVFSSFWVYSGLDTELICVGVAVPCFIASINAYFIKETANSSLGDIQKRATESEATQETVKTGNEQEDATAI